MLADPACGLPLPGLFRRLDGGSPTPRTPLVQRQLQVAPRQDNGVHGGRGHAGGRQQLLDHAVDGVVYLLAGQVLAHGSLGTAGGRDALTIPPGVRRLKVRR